MIQKWCIGTLDCVEGTCKLPSEIFGYYKFNGIGVGCNVCKILTDLTHCKCGFVKYCKTHSINDDVWHLDECRKCIKIK